MTRGRIGRMGAVVAAGWCVAIGHAAQPTAVPALFAAQVRVVRADDGTPMMVREGRIRVPELRSDAESGAIELAVVRVGRAEAASRTAHIVLAGGPGDSGVNLILGLAQRGGASIFDLIDGDLIGFDQRGTGKSIPNLETKAVLGLPLDAAGSEQAWTPIIQKASREEADGFRARGIRLEAYNTLESAHDVDAVRRALGYDRLVVWGRSYGSHLALATLRAHPAAIDRVVLANPEGPDHTLKSPALVDAVLARLAKVVSSDPSLGTRVPDLVSLMRRVFARLDRQPVSVDVMHPLTRTMQAVTVGAFDLQWVTALALGDPRTVATLPTVYVAMDAGDFRNIAQVVAMQKSRLGPQSAMKQMMDLSSGATSARRERVNREAATALLGNAINVPLAWMGDAWRHVDLGDAFRAAVHSNVPVLVLAGDLDARTPLENAHQIARTLTRSHLVVVENGFHQFDLFGSTPLREVLRQFLAGAPVTTTRISIPAPRFQ